MPKASTQKSDSSISASFNLKDVAHMNQEQISKIVFSFNKSITDIDIFEEKDFQYNFLRDAIKSAPNMKEIPNSYLPSFQLFQIKKGITMSKDGKKRCTLQFIDISK